MIPSARSIGRQAAVRLLASLGLFVLLVVASTVLIYRTVHDKSSQERAEAMRSFYQTRLAQLESEWELHARDVRVRIEYTRILENRGTAHTQLQAFLTIQGSNQRYQRLVIQNREGTTLFAFGKGDVNPAALGVIVGDWHYQPGTGQLYRIFMEPLWLGEEGMGRLVLFFPVDHALLGEMVMPGVELTAVYHGKEVASSLGAAGLEPEPRRGREDGDWSELAWLGKQDCPTRLKLRTTSQPLFSIGEITIGASLIPLLHGLILWFVMGLWLMRQSGRIFELGDAVQLLARDSNATAAFQDKIDRAAAGGDDEIRTVANAIGTMTRQTQSRERALAQALGMFRAAVEGTPVAMIMADDQGRIGLANAAAERLFGHERNNLVGQPVEMLLPERFRAHHPGMRDGYFAAPAVRRMGEGRQLRALRKDGSEVAVEIGLTPIETAEGMYALASIIDITGHTRAQEIIQASLREKTSLLNEIHHRVKNNLQVMASLLSLQAGQVQDPQCRAMLAESERRVHVMALVHHMLYEREDFANVHLGDYLRRLAQLLAGMHGCEPRGISLRLELDDIELELTRAIPCGLIINELLTNSFKHAFAEGQGGEIALVLTNLGAGQARLTVSDNGPGLPEGFVLERGGGLGMQLVLALVEQMGATLVVGKGPGASFELRFTANEDN